MTVIGIALVGEAVGRTDVARLLLGGRPEAEEVAGTDEDAGSAEVVVFSGVLHDTEDDAEPVVHQNS